PRRLSLYRGGVTAIYLGSRLPGTSSGLPVPSPPLDRVRSRGPSRAARRSRRRGLLRTERDCLALHPVGFAWPPPSPGAPVGSYPTISPITCAKQDRVRSSLRHRLGCVLLHLPSPCRGPASAPPPRPWRGTVACGRRP